MSICEIAFEDGEAGLLASNSPLIFSDLILLSSFSVLLLLSSFSDLILLSLVALQGTTTVAAFFFKDSDGSTSRKLNGGISI